MNSIIVTPLKGYKIFDRVFQSGKRIYSGPAASVVCHQEIETYDFKLCLGVTVSKRIAKKAVIRNRIKRLLRESVRLAIKEMQKRGTTIPISKMIINWRQAPDMQSKIKLDDVLPHIVKILNKAETYYSKQVSAHETSNDISN